MFCQRHVPVRCEQCPFCGARSPFAADSGEWTA
jgi:hypothetical protein